jgi:hypothetical protein
MAMVTGVVWGVVRGFLPLFFLNVLLGAGAGYVIGEVMSLAVNRKRGRGLMAAAGLAVVLSFIVSIFLPWQPWFLLLRLSVIRIIIDLVTVAAGVFIAVNRFR